MNDVAALHPHSHTLVIVGAGRFARIAADAWARVAGVRVTAVADIDAGAARSLAERFSAACVEPDEALSGDVAGIAYIATPPWTQSDFAKRALRSGMHVVCEKPMGLTRAEVEDVAATARESRRIASVDFLQRHGALASSVRVVVEEGVLGAPLHAYFENYAADEELPAEHWFWDPRRSGGIFVEHAVHFFDLFRWWFGDGDVLSATASVRDAAPAERITDQVTCTTAHGPVLVHQYHGFHQPNALDRQRLGVVFERGDILLNGWIPVSATVRGLVDDLQLQRLRQLFPGANRHRRAVAAGTRGRGRTIAVSHDVTITTAEQDKPALNLDLLHARFTDVIAAVANPRHHQRVTVADAAAAVGLAEEATRVARIVSTSSESFERQRGGASGLGGGI